jgi:hypothetical protein
MMTKIKEDKKREILAFLENNADADRVLQLELSHVVDQFVDDTYDTEKIEAIIDELGDDGLIERKTAKLEVIYPRSYRESIEDRLGDLAQSPVFSTFFWGFLAYAVLMTWDPAFELLVSNPPSGSPQDTYVSLGLSGLIGSWILGNAILWLYGRTEEQIPVFREYQYLILPVIGIGTALGLGVWGYSSMSGQEVEITHIILIISVSLGAGVSIGKIFFENKE